MLTVTYVVASLESVQFNLIIYFKSLFVLWGKKCTWLGTFPRQKSFVESSCWFQSLLPYFNLVYRNNLAFSQQCQQCQFLRLPNTPCLLDVLSGTTDGFQFFLYFYQMLTCRFNLKDEKISALVDYIWKHLIQNSWSSVEN